MQTAMDSWKSKVKELQKQLDESSSIMRKIDTTVGTINGRLGNFMKRYETPLSDIMYDVRSTSQALLEMNWSGKLTTFEEKGNGLPLLEYRTGVLLQKLSRLLLEKEAMTRDREFCRRLLESSDRSRPLSDVLHEKLESLRKEREKISNNVRNMKFRLIATEEQMKLKENDLLLIEDALKQARAKTEIMEEQKQSETLPLAEAGNEGKTFSVTRTQNDWGHMCLFNFDFENIHVTVRLCFFILILLNEAVLVGTITRNAVSRCWKSHHGAIVTPKYNSPGFVKKPNTAVATVPPIRSEIVPSPVSPISNEKTFLLSKTPVS